ncbi:MAG: hypothetical protein GKS00_25200 [Alphaproteobacteria bacterium]|nr:hypothetical protein [Alphaproteobacteria bacterium]
MSLITGDFVAKLAKVWHRFTLSDQDSETLATMLAPMDDAGEAVSGDIEFDMEPSDFDIALEKLAAPRDKS